MAVERNVIGLERELRILSNTFEDFGTTRGRIGAVRQSFEQATRKTKESLLSSGRSAEKSDIDNRIQVLLAEISSNWEYGLSAEEVNLKGTILLDSLDAAVAITRRQLGFRGVLLALLVTMIANPTTRAKSQRFRFRAFIDAAFGTALYGAVSVTAYAAYQDMQKNKFRREAVMKFLVLFNERNDFESREGRVEGRVLRMKEPKSE